LGSQRSTAGGIVGLAFLATADALRGMGCHGVTTSPSPRYSSSQGLGRFQLPGPISAAAQKRFVLLADDLNRLFGCR
jgi:hypothetical protein